MNSRLRIPDWLLLLAFCGFFFVWRLSSFGLIGADEPRYAQVAREMLDRRDWITPTLSGTAWLEKPPLYYWQAMLAYRLFGVSDWAARLPSAMDASVLAYAIFIFIRRFRPGFELDGALMLATSAGIVGYARAASMDMPLAAAFAIAMLAWYAWFESGSRKYLAIFYGSLALATLAKGPVAPFLAAIVILIFAALEGSVRIAWKTVSLPGMVLFCAIALPWYIAVQLRNPEFLHVFILEHNLARFGTNLYHHTEPFWYYLPVTALAWMPWTIILIAALLWTGRRFRNPGEDVLRKYLVIWVCVVVVFFSLSQSKLPGYVLPALPAGLLLGAEYVSERSNNRPSTLVAALHGVTASSLISGALVMPYIVLRQLRFDRALIAPAIVLLACAALVCFFLRKSGYRLLRALTVVPAVLTLAIALRAGAPGLDQTLSARQAAGALRSVNPKQLPVAVFGVARETEFGLAFYLNQVVPRYESGQVPAQEHLLVAPHGSLTSVSGAAGRRAELLDSYLPQKLDFFYVPAIQH